MATRYQELQEVGASAFRTYTDQRKRAAQIMNAVANVLIEEMGFPKANVVFTETAKSGEENSGRVFAEQVIDRDEKGRWNSCMNVRVDAPGCGHVVTDLFLEVHFADNEVQLSLVGDDKAVSLSVLPGASKTQFASSADRVMAKITETIELFRAGIGEKPQIGFGANPPA